MSLMSALCHYSGAFESQCGESFVDAHIKDTIDDLMNAAFLATASLATYMSHVRVAKAVKFNAELLPQVERLSKGHPTRLNLSNTHFDDKNLLSTSNVDVLYHLEAADCMLKKQHRKYQFPFHIQSFYSLVLSYLR